VKKFLDYMEEKKIDMKSIHTSGHATVGTLKKLVAKLKPAMIIPIHTQAPENYTEHFENVRIVCDGVAFTIPG
jgi:ribonuclease J